MIQPKNLKQDPLQAISNAGCLAIASAAFHQRSRVLPGSLCLTQRRQDAKGKKRDLSQDPYPVAWLLHPQRSISVHQRSTTSIAPSAFHQRRLAVPIQRSLINGKKSGAPDLCLVILHPQKFRQSHFLGAFRAQENLLERDASRQASIPLKMVVMTIGRSESNVVHENVATVLDPLR